MGNFYTHTKLLNFFLLICLNLLITNNIQSQTVTEEAEYVLNFIEFTDWSEVDFETSSSPIIVGIYNSTDRQAVFKEVITSEIINNRKLEVTSITTAGEIALCNIVYFPVTDGEEMTELLHTTRWKQILTIGKDITGFCENGGIVNLTFNSNNSRFEINHSQAVEVNIIINSQVLRMAKIINTNH